MVDNEIRTAKCCQCNFYFRDDSVDLVLAASGIAEVDAGIFGVFLRQLCRDDIEPGFAIIGIKPAMGINVRSDVADSNGCMPTFVTFMVVTVGFEGRTFTVGQYCGVSVSSSSITLAPAASVVRAPSSQGVSLSLIQNTRSAFSSDAALEGRSE